MEILANIVAYLFILTLIGFFVVIALIVTAGLKFYTHYKRIKAMAMPPKDAAMGIVNAGKGAYLRGSIRVRAIADTGRGAVQKVMAVKDEIAGAAQSVDVDETREAARNARDTVASTLSTTLMSLQLLKQLFAIVSQARHPDGSKPAA